jgi:hypothetical protein
LDGETSEPIDATNHQRMRSSGTLHTKHLAHSSTEIVPMKSSHAPAKSNSYMGLPRLALSGSTLSTGAPETGSFVRPLLVNALFLGALKKRLPVRELSVASMMAVKRPMRMGSEKKASRSAAASGPLKHVSSMHSSCSFQPVGLK